MSWLLDDEGIARSYREINGWGIHTYKWINSDGDATLIRYKFESDQGVHSLDDPEAVE